MDTLFHLFCEFPDGSSQYLHLRTSSKKEAVHQAIRVYCASVVLVIVSNIDTDCKLLGFEYNCGVDKN